MESCNCESIDHESDQGGTGHPYVGGSGKAPLATDPQFRAIYVGLVCWQCWTGKGHNLTGPMSQLDARKDAEAEARLLKGWQTP